MERDAVIEAENRYVMDTYGRYDVVPESGEGTILRDRDGTEYLDFLAGIATNVLGHSHPAVVEAVREQAEKLTHCSNFYYIENQSRLAELLAEETPFHKSFYCNSGTEAIEASIKLARRGTDGHEVVALKDAFHGRTLGALSATWKEKYREPFEPLVPGYRFADKTPESLKQHVNENTAAVIMEPVQGEGGVLENPAELVETARDLCTDNDALLVFDEVQTGIGRTGRFLGHEWFDVEADAAALAKGLGNGFPVGALLARDGLEFGRGEHASTFGGNPLATAAATATVETVIERDLPGRAVEIGSYLRERLLDVDYVTGVRGRGLLLGAQLDRDADPVVDHALKNGILLNAVTDTAIRLAPPLNVEKEHVDRVVSVLDEA